MGVVGFARSDAARVVGRRLLVLHRASRAVASWLPSWSVNGLRETRSGPQPRIPVLASLLSRVVWGVGEKYFRRTAMGPSSWTDKASGSAVMGIQRLCCKLRGASGVNEEPFLLVILVRLWSDPPMPKCPDKNRCKSI